MSEAMLATISALNGFEFEDWLKKSYEGIGYHVEKTSKHADYGTDLILTDEEGVRTGVQAKLRNGRNIGVESVQQCHGGGEHYGCSKTLVITNSRFTTPGKKLAKSLGVDLMDGPALVNKFGVPADIEAHVPKHNREIVDLPDDVEHVEHVEPEATNEVLPENVLAEFNALVSQIAKDAIENQYRNSFMEPFSPGDDFNEMRPYDWQVDFHNASSDWPERALICANRVGKSMTGAREMVAHLTGEYPPWWTGRRFDHHIRAWVGSDTNETSREIVQAALLGESNGSGWLPADSIVEVKYRQAGIADVVDYVTVRHVSGGISRLQFKTYEQGRKKWQGTSIHVLWFDEEPPQDVWTEGLTRTLDTEGLTYMTFTPLSGMSDVVLHYVDGGPGIWMKQATWDDAPHLSEEEKDRMVMSYPVYERETRRNGVPLAGSGVIYTMPDQAISVDAFTIPNHWARIVGIDFGIEHPAAAVWLAWDRDQDVMYLYDCYCIAGQTAAYHVDAIRSKGDWIPVSWPHDGMQREKSSGEPLAEAYRQKGLKMLSVSARYDDSKGGAVAREPIIHECDDRMRTGRLKVFSHLQAWFKEKRMYHRDEGKVVDKFDDLMSAMHYAVMMKRYATPELRRPMPSQTGYFDPLSVIQSEQPHGQSFF